MTYKMHQLRAIDAEIVNHVIARGKLWERRNKIALALQGSDEFACYQAELKEWLESIIKDSTNNKPPQGGGENEQYST